MIIIISYQKIAFVFYIRATSSVTSAPPWDFDIIYFLYLIIKRRKANWIGCILRRNCLLKHVIEGKLEGRIEMTGRRGRRRTQLPSETCD
jgi:hypothetical protein